jgi:hypothetical protein
MHALHARELLARQYAMRIQGRSKGGSFGGLPLPPWEGKRYCVAKPRPLLRPFFGPPWDIPGYEPVRIYFISTHASEYGELQIS